jgi:tetratricopeptide (TPR) repeat protein
MYENRHAESAGVHYGLGLSLQHLGRVLDSAHHYHRALTLRPDYAEAALNLAALHHRQACIESPQHTLL